MRHARALVEPLRAAAPHGLRLGARGISEADGASLHPVEQEAVRSAVPSRRSEFASGRTLLRELLALDVAIPVGPSRAPVMPPGWHGSLSHDHEYVVGAVSDDPGVIGIGIDIGSVTDLDREIASVVLRPEERGLRPDLAFVLKEAAFKAWSARGGALLEHHDVSVRHDGACFVAEVLPDGAVLTGRFVASMGRWLALVVRTGT